ncbi:MAG: NAD(P)/FAD-dependent oxidoreductase [Flavobacteriaceae bacterium]|nr:NAD(P)/FAD-dependent oxidoreductase [Flavobacteriaceae bacterium]
MQKNITIVGAGLCGALLGLRLGQLGHRVTLYEKRPDMRKQKVDAGRSINLALSDRGLAGLRLVGLEDEAKKLCIPMHGRMIHPLNGEAFLSRYSGRKEEYINSISREGLNALMLDAADRFEQVQIRFEQAVSDVDLSSKQMVFNNQEKVQYDYLFGTDGAGSVVRKYYEKQRSFLFSHSIDWLSHSYKELSIPANEQGGWKIEKHALHIWPRGGFMLIALPNLDGSFTVTLFLSRSEGKESFMHLNTEQKVQQFFKDWFPDVIPLIPDLTEQFFQNPTSALGTVKCRPWNADANTLLMGDAAHAIVPFYGQGMNASFEDVLVFDRFLNTSKNWGSVFEDFANYRKPDTDAIADLAIDNFYEMRDNVAHEDFQRKRKIEMRLEEHFDAFDSQTMKGYSSKYSLVTFNEVIGYNQAMQRGRAQDKAILSMLKEGVISENDDLDELLKAIQEKTKSILALNKY